MTILSGSHKIKNIYVILLTKHGYENVKGLIKKKILCLSVEMGNTDELARVRSFEYVIHTQEFEENRY